MPVTTTEIIKGRRIVKFQFPNCLPVDLIVEYDGTNGIPARVGLKGANGAVVVLAPHYFKELHQYCKTAGWVESDPLPEPPKQNTENL
jgi:hypothetical protein